MKTTILAVLPFLTFSLLFGLDPREDYTPTSSASFGKILFNVDQLLTQFPDWQAMRVMGDSMEPLMGKNSVVLFQPVDLQNLQVGSVVVFRDSSGDNVVHQVRDIQADGLVTKGYKNQNPDSDLLTEDRLLGKVVAVFNAKEIPEYTVYLRNGGVLQTAYGKRN